MNTKSFLILFFIFTSFIVFSTEQTEIDKNNEILSFGLENEIIELISDFRKKSNKDYNDILEKLFYSTRSIVIKDSILSLYSDQKNDAFVDWSISILEDPYEYTKSTVLAVFSYLTVLEVKEAAPEVRKILESENPDFRDKAIVLLGKIGSTSDSDFLFDYMESEISGDEKERLVIRQNIMNSLGEMRADNAWSRLFEIAQDQDENTVIRSTAVVALSKMQNKDAIDLLLKLLEEKDPLLRVAAIKGLSEFSGKNVVDAIFDGVKDSYYKVRLEAITAIEKMNIHDAGPYLLYRAKTDPVELIRFRSFEVIGYLHYSEGTNWLLEQFNSDKASDKSRIKACSVLFQHDFSLIKTSFNTVIIELLKDDKKKNLRYELGKLISNSDKDIPFSIGEGFLLHSDTLTRSIGLDIFEKTKDRNLLPIVEKIAGDEKQGALYRRAKKLIDEK